MLLRRSILHHRHGGADIRAAQQKIKGIRSKRQPKTRRLQTAKAYERNSRRLTNHAN